MENNNNTQKAKLNIFYAGINDTPQSCGYCKTDGKKNKTSYKWGFGASEMPADLYENIMFLGYRRCGDYYYKNDVSKSCCKLYSMRLDVDRYKINKNQKKVMKNFRKYLVGESFKNVEIDFEMNDQTDVDPYDTEINELVDEFVQSEIFKQQFGEFNIDLKFKIFFNKNNKFGDYSSNVFIVIYQTLKNTEEYKAKYNTPKGFYTFIFELFNKSVQERLNNKFKVTLSENTGHLNFFVTNDADFVKFREDKLKKENQPKKQKTKKVSMLNKDEKEYKLEYFQELVTSPIIAENKFMHKYTIELEPTTKFSDEKFEVYKKYQRAIHGDKEKDLTKERFIQSWGTSDLKSSKTFNSTNPIHPKAYGTYDLIHRIDGKIVAVGILDILPTSVSSVYLYYDPEYGFLNLGILTAIREIEFVKNLNMELDNGIKYYVMGFYCYTCQKMKYKGSYHPSEILCPLTHNFVDLDSNLDKIKDGKVQQLSELPKISEVEVSKLEIIDIIKKITLDYQGTAFDFMMFITNFIDQKYKKILITTVENLIETLGKNNFRRFKLMAD
jgi:arginine-tRNA-protein transferase